MKFREFPRLLDSLNPWESPTLPRVHEQIKKIVESGFKLGPTWSLQDLSILSLRQALISYYSTYSAVRFRLKCFLQERQNGNVAEDLALNYSVYCTQTIFFFQHFFELVFKSILSEVSPIMVLKKSTKPLILYKLATSEPLTDADYSGINTVAFDESKKRLTALIKDKKVDSELTFLTDPCTSSALDELNTLRNKMWHRGTFILNYSALDLFIGGYILPVVSKVVQLPRYIEKTEVWAHKTLTCSIDPLTELIRVLAPTTRSDNQLITVALLKELGRAAYVNPRLDPLTVRTAESTYDWGESVTTKERLRQTSTPRNRRIMVARATVGLHKHSDKTSREDSELLAQTREVERVAVCPVCDTSSLCFFSESGEEDDITFDYIVCQCCSFEIGDEIGSAGYNSALGNLWERSDNTDPKNAS